MAGVSNRVPSTRDLLLFVMYELLEKDLKRFKLKLNEGGLMEGYSGIPRAKLENADVIDVVELVVNFYTMENAVQVCRTVLEEINQRELAARLEDI